MKVAIDCGHTLRGADTGAEGCGRLEQNCTREIGNALLGKLKALGYDARIVSVDGGMSSLGESLATRVNNANNWGADLYVSIHLNCGGGHGTEVFTYKGRELAYARNTLNEICNNFGYTNRGLKGASLYVTNHTNMPAFLVECCFIDSQSDMARYDANKFADCICRGITGSTSNVTHSNPQPSQPQQSQGNNWVARLQQECNNQGFSNQAVDNIPGINTLNGCPTLRQGASGDITRLLQEKLVSLGYNTNGIDGIFGSGTRSAVISFQRDNGLTQDGIMGQQSWNCLIHK